MLRVKPEFEDWQEIDADFTQVTIDDFNNKTPALSEVYSLAFYLRCSGRFNLF